MTEAARQRTALRRQVRLEEVKKMSIKCGYNMSAYVPGLFR
jgi:hypothetical protein